MLATNMHACVYWVKSHVIKTHDSESRGQEEAAYATTE